MPKKLAFDHILFGAALLLACIGILMVASAAAASTIDSDGWAGTAALKQFVLAAAGLTLMFLIMFTTRYQTLKKPWLAWGGLGASAALLVAALFMPAKAGVHRWIVIGPVTIQPSEIAKVALIFFLAWYLSRPSNSLERKWQPFFMAVGLTAMTALLVELGRDLGTAAVVTAVGVSLLFFAGAPKGRLGMLAVAAIPPAVLLIYLFPFRLQRLLSFLDPEKDPLGASYQLNQSLIAVSIGGATGVGLGEAQQKLFFLPQPASDFIFSVIGEETGFIGCAIVVALYVVILWRGLRTAVYAHDDFGRYLAAGVTMMIVLQGMVNISVAVGLVPTTGLPLPLVSSGGTALLMTMVGLGLLLNVSQFARQR